MSGTRICSAWNTACASNLVLESQRLAPASGDVSPCPEDEREEVMPKFDDSSSPFPLTGKGEVEGITTTRQEPPVRMKQTPGSRPHLRRSVPCHSGRGQAGTRFRSERE